MAMRSQPSDAFDADCEARGLLLTRLAAGRLELPIMPATAAQVLEASRDENVGARLVPEILNRDPNLAVHVLRVANSAAYSPREPVLSLSHAVTRMGLTAIAQIAVAVCIKGRVFRADRYVHLITPVWPRSTVAAGWGREMASLKGWDVEGGFLLGLLHDVGRPVIIQALVDIERETGRSFGEDQARNAMDLLHPRVGAELMDQWKMPDWMGDAVAWHEDPWSAPQNKDQALIAFNAEHLARWTIESEAADDEPIEPEDHRGLRDLGVEGKALRNLLDARDRIRAHAECLA